MPSAKTVALAVLAVGLTVGVLFATGLLKLRPDPPKDDDAKAEAIDQLESLGYAGAVEVRPEHRDKVGVTRALQGRFDPDGLGIGTPLGWGAAYHKAGGQESMNEARLIDMKGEVVHRWEYRLKRKDKKHGWDVARLHEDGTLYALYDRNALLVLDWDSKLVRKTRGRFHHDFAFADDGRIVVMDEQRRRLVDPVDGYEYDLLDHGFTILDGEGNKERTLWLHDALADEEFYEQHLEKRLDRWRPARTKRGEPFQVADFHHANTVEILAEDAPGLWSAGDLMTTVRELDTLVVLSATDGRLLWSWGPGPLDRPHDPSQIEGPLFMVFDNRWHAKRSRVIQVRAPQAAIEWTYEGTQADPFFSKKRGLAQLLDNSRIVINSSQNARTFVVERDGTIVWEYFAPDMVGDYRVPMRYIRLQGPQLAAARARLDAVAP